MDGLGRFEGPVRLLLTRLSDGPGRPGQGHRKRQVRWRTRGFPVACVEMYIGSIILYIYICTYISYNISNNSSHTNSNNKKKNCNKKKTSNKNGNYANDERW